MITLHTNLGDIGIELDTENTKETAANFLKYAQEGFYDGTIFHRVIKRFMIQGGGFEKGMREKKAGVPIHNEAEKGQENKRGTIAMARTSDPHSASCQFFINTKDNDFLNFKHSNSNDGWGYCVFGSVVSGMDVVDKIEAVATTKHGFHSDVPVEEVVIESVSFPT